MEDLERAVASDEADLDNYLRLAEAYTQAGRFRETMQVLKRALEASGGSNLAIRERLEDAQIRMVRAQVVIAEQRAAAESTQEAADLVKRFRVELNRQELQVFAQRTERYPRLESGTSWGFSSNGQELRQAAWRLRQPGTGESGCGRRANASSSNNMETP
jgi:tetratricopeptide (TPR) repeat protein